MISIPPWRRAVLKVGSALVAPGGQQCSTQYTLAIARFIIESHRQGKEVILVSSGAVAAGLSTQPDLLDRPQRSIPEKQALAAIGQSLMMASWSRLFDVPCAQLLLTYDDLFTRKRFINARNTLTKLLELGTLPIVNENDTVAVEELKVGDNDNLAAHVAVLADADLLIICSDIDGLYDADPRSNPAARHIPVVNAIDDSIYALAGGTSTAFATGGMRTKIAAADKATSRGIDTVILNGTDGSNFHRLLAGEMPGTIFQAHAAPLSARKHWMRHTVPTAGRIEVDAGAAQAITTQGASLLPSGIVAVEGNFTPGDAVEVVVRDHEAAYPIAKGITQYGSRDLHKIRGHHSTAIAEVLGSAPSDVIIHRDDLVLLQAAA